MRKSTLLLAVAFLWGITAAHGGEPSVQFDQEKIAIYPPQQYDHPYKGRLDIRYGDEKELPKHCPANKYGQRLGCTVVATPTYCVIYIGPADELEAAGYTDTTIVRHEIGHCNGWPADHPGMRALKEGGTTDEFRARQFRWKAFALRTTKQ